MCSSDLYTCTTTDANNCTRKDTVTVTEPTALLATKNFAATKCNGGTDGKASVTVSGGTGAYTYVWKRGDTTNLNNDNDTAFNLTAGFYTCTTTDANNCTRKDTVTVTEPTALSASKGSAQPKCKDGSDGKASVTVSGGTGAYT